METVSSWLGPAVIRKIKQLHLLLSLSVFLLQLNPALCQRGQISHVVGGESSYWGLQGDHSFYQNWAYRQQFIVGDKLIFHVSTSTTTPYTYEHTVVQYPDNKSFLECDPSGGMKFLWESEMPEIVKVDLTAPGLFYYGCSKQEYCNRGQRFFIKVWPAPEEN